MIKTNKALAKRVKVTGRGKLLVRPKGQNHFNAKDTGGQGRKKRHFLKLSGITDKSVASRITR